MTFDKKPWKTIITTTITDTVSTRKSFSELY